jgi:hypothetical protein
MPGGGAVTGEVVVPVAVAVAVGVVAGVEVGVVAGITPGVVTVPVLDVVTGVGTGVVLTGVVLTGVGTGAVLTGSGDECQWCEPPPSCRGWPSWRSAPNRSCKNAWRSCGNVLGTAPEEVPVVALVPLVVVVVVVVAGVVVGAGVEVVPVVPEVPVPAAVPAELWLVTNCVNAERSAVNRVPPPPCTPPPESESPSLSVFPAKLRVALNKEDRLAAGLVPDTAFVVMMLSLY